MNREARKEIMNNLISGRVRVVSREEFFKELKLKGESIVKYLSPKERTILFKNNQKNKAIRKYLSERSYC